jgi:predicted nucleotidyltransferase
VKPSIAYQNNRGAIRTIVERHNARNPRVFGSVIRGTDTDSSDLDILIDTTENTSLLDIGAIHVELTELLGVDVDVLTPDSLPERWRAEVINEALQV